MTAVLPLHKRRAIDIETATVSTISPSSLSRCMSSDSEDSSRPRGESTGSVKSNQSICEALSADELITRAASYVCLHEVLALKAASPRIRAAAAPASLMNGSYAFYVCGGANGAETLKSAERFNSKESTWEYIPDMFEKRRCAAAAVVASRLYIIGGSDGATVLRTVERFDTEVNSWEKVPPMHDARAWASAGAIGGILYACAGTDSARIQRNHLNTAEQYDPEVNDWTCLPSMLEARICAAAGVLLGHMFVCGGSAGSKPLSTVEAWDPQRAVWTRRPPMPSARRSAACCSIGDTTLCVCGGEDDKGTMASAVLFAIECGTWTEMPDMSQGAWWSVAAASSDSVYVFGGTDGALALDRVERFNLASMQWQLLPPMLQGRNSAAAGAIAGRDRVVFL